MAARITRRSVENEKAKAREARKTSLLSRTAEILARTAKAFITDNVSRLGAALAFYTTIAVAPLLVLAIAVAGFLFQGGTARAEVTQDVEWLLGPQARAVVESIQSPATTTTGTIATLVGAATLMFGALGVFHHLQDALNSIWRVHTPPIKDWMHFVRRRLFSLATVMVSGFLLLVSLILSSILTWIGKHTATYFQLSVALLQIANDLLSLTVVTCLFAMIFKLLPDTKIRWRHVWLGALVTGVLFTVGKNALTFYLGHTIVMSAYGTAGTLVALLLWSYYAGQIVFIGAEFTRITSESDGGLDFRTLETAPRTKT
ncbi:MAG: ribonuclease [Verrucomicrobia bacterium]|nr:ribonuclease [Verrucomicrobiota bacterium]